MSYPGSPLHTGLDAFAQDWGRRGVRGALGTPILAPMDGLVIVSERRDRLGELVMSCLDTVCVSMAHLERRSVRVGDHVRRGVSKIGTVGATGLLPTWGVPHLHLSLIRRHDRAVVENTERDVPLRFRFDNCA